MKKYLLGILAIVLAVGFSAFTAKEQNGTAYGFWYTVDATGTALVSEIYADAQNPLERFDSEIGAPCNLSDGQLCVVGSATQLTPGVDGVPAPASNEDNYIFKIQE